MSGLEMSKKKRYCEYRYLTNGRAARASTRRRESGPAARAARACTGNPPYSIPSPRPPRNALARALFSAQPCLKAMPLEELPCPCPASHTTHWPPQHARAAPRRPFAHPAHAGTHGTAPHGLSATLDFVQPTWQRTQPAHTPLWLPAATHAPRRRTRHPPRAQRPHPSTQRNRTGNARLPHAPCSFMQLASHRTQSA